MTHLTSSKPIGCWHPGESSLEPLEAAVENALLDVASPIYVVDRRGRFAVSQAGAADLGRRSTGDDGALPLHAYVPPHHADAHRHLFPLSEWRFHSPVSYWDPSHYGHITAPLEGLLFGLCCLLLARRATSRHARLFLGLLVLVYALYWGYVFWIWA